MLTLYDPQPSHDCQGFHRREFLRVGSLGLLGMGLSAMLGRSADASEVKDYITGKSVVFLFLGGGPSHIEFFDPKMDAPSEIHSVTGEVKTVHPGITFGGTFPGSQPSPTSSPSFAPSSRETPDTNTWR